MSSSSSSVSSSNSSGSSHSSNLWPASPPAGYYLDNEGRLWRMSSSSSDSSQSSSSDSSSSDSSSSVSSSSDSSSSVSSSSNSSSSSSNSSSSSSDSSSSSSESSESSESSSSSNSSSSDSSLSSSDSSSSDSSSSDSSSSRDGLWHHPPEGYLMDNEGHMWAMPSSSSSSSNSLISSSSSFSSSSQTEVFSDPIPDISDDELDALLAQLNITNDVDVTTNDVDVTTNDVDVTTNDVDVVIQAPQCSISLKNNNNAFEIWDGQNILHKFNQTSEKFIFAQCGYSHSVTFTAYGSFIFDVGVDINNTQDTSTKGDFLDLAAGGTLVLTASTKNIRFTGGVGETATIVFTPAPIPVPVPVVPPTPACAPAHGCLTDNESIRRFVLDRMIDDNLIDLDLFFTDEEINHARYLAVANWNEIPPYVGAINLTTCDECLPYPTIFVNGIAYYLYLSKIQKLQKEDLDYNAGGMQVDLNKRRIAHLSQNIKNFKEEFIALAASRKTHINYQGAWGQIG